MGLQGHKESDMTGLRSLRSDSKKFRKVGQQAKHHEYCYAV